jgi:uroporphyrinogen-III synthase
LGKLSGLRLVSFESRRAMEIREMIRRQGGEVMSAPALREVPMSENAPALEFARRIARGEIDVAIFLTGVGTRYLAESIASELCGEKLSAALAAIVTVARGPKPGAALWELCRIRPTLVVPEPNTWREVVAAMETILPPRGLRVAIQEYGEENPELIAALVSRGAEVLRVPIYRWALPQDLDPLRCALAEILAGRVDVAIFTSATQANHFFQIAGSDGEALRRAFSRVVVASIGPVCSATLREQGLTVDLEPDRFKMGNLISCIADRAAGLVRQKKS